MHHVLPEQPEAPRGAESATRTHDGMTMKSPEGDQAGWSTPGDEMGGHGGSIPGWLGFVLVAVVIVVGVLIERSRRRRK